MRSSAVSRWVQESPRASRRSTPRAFAVSCSPRCRPAPRQEPASAVGRWRSPTRSTATVLEAAGARYAWGPESGLDANAAKLVRLGFLEHAPHAIAHTLRELLAVQPGWRALANSLGALALPTLVIAGERDPVSLAPCRELAQALDGAALIVVPDAGHVVNLEARDAVNVALRDFVQQLAPA